MRLSIFHSTSRALREFFLVLVQGYERAPRVSQLPICTISFTSFTSSGLQSYVRSSIIFNILEIGSMESTISSGNHNANPRFTSRSALSPIIPASAQYHEAHCVQANPSEAGRSVFHRSHTDTRPDPAAQRPKVLSPVFQLLP